jgi:hypothetical protein
MPPTALVTEIAGVKMPSAIVRLIKNSVRQRYEHCWKYSRSAEETLTK